MKKTQGVFTFSDFEVSENVLQSARLSRRPLVRVLFSANAELTEEEQKVATENGMTAEEIDALKASKSERYSQIFNIETDLKVPCTPAPTDPALISAWDYATAALPVLRNKFKKFLCTAYTFPIVDLLAGTPFATGIREDGTEIVFTAVRNEDGTKTYATHSKVYVGFFNDEQTAFNTVKNSLLSALRDGSEQLGADDSELECFNRKLEKIANKQA